TQIKCVMLRAIFQIENMRSELSVLFPNAALDTVGPKLLRRNTHRDAGAAALAIGTIGERSAAAKARFHELAVDRGVDQMAGCCYLRTRHLLRKIAARVRRCRIKLQH